MESPAFSEDSPQFFKIFSPKNCYKQMRIPPKFMKNFKNTNPFRSTLRTSDERAWQVDVIKDDRYLYFENGWQEFVQYYSLEDGNFLLFYYNDNAQFDVTIFGFNARPKPLPTCTDGMEVEENIQTPETAVNSDNPSFEIVMRSTYINGRSMTLPVRFWKNYMREDRDTAKLYHLNKSWEVKLVRYSHLDITLITGNWRKFVADNNLRENLICKFELISTDDYVFDVSIRNSNCKSKYTCCPKQLPARTDKAPGVYSDNPSFEKVLKRSYVKNYMSVPKKFWKIYMRKDLTARLIHSSKSWEVKFQRQRFSAGWHKFVKDNNLRENFICRFELISLTDFVFNVTVREPGCKPKGKSKQI